MGDLWDEPLNPPASGGRVDAQNQWSLSVLAIFRTESPEKYRSRVRVNVSGGAVNLLDKTFSELPPAVATLEDLLLIVSAKPDDLDRATLDALDRVFREHPRLGLLLKLDG